MRTGKPVTALAAAVVLSGCGPLLFAEVESEETCLTLPDIAFPGAHGAAGTAADLGYDLAAELPLLDEEEVDAELRLLTVRIAPAQGTTVDLSGVEQVRIVARLPPGSGRPDRELLRYDRDPAAPPPHAIEATGPADVNLADWLTDGELALRAEYAGTSLPAEDWTAQVRACFHARVKYDYGTAAGL
jgi:hypothetical protein